MTNSPQTPPPSPEEQRIRQQMRKRIRQETTDEWIAIIVAFGTIGAILFWSLGMRKDNILSLEENRFSADSESVLESEGALEERVIVEADDLEFAQGETQIFEREVPTLELETSLDNIEIERSNRRVNNFLTTAPLIGATEAEPELEVTEPEIETELEPEIAEPEIEVEQELEIAEPEIEVEPEPEVTEPETEATAPEVVPEPEDTEPETEQPLAFVDVTEDYWAYPFIQRLGEQGFFSPTTEGQFQPDDLITRATMANLIAQAFDGSGSIETKNFKDIDDGNKIAEDIDEAVRSGFMKGYSEDEFRPAENIPRYQVLVALATGLNLEPSGDPTNILQQFSDRDEIPNWAISQVAAATEAGLTVNRPDFDLQSLRPEEPATRAEVAAMIYQALLQQGQVESLDSPYIVPKP